MKHPHQPYTQPMTTYNTVWTCRKYYLSVIILEKRDFKPTLTDNIQEKFQSKTAM